MPTAKVSTKDQPAEREHSRPSKKRTKRSKSFDTSKLADEVFESVDGLFGFTTVLGLPEDMARDLARDIVEVVASSYSSKPDPESLIKRIKRNVKVLNEHVVAKLLEILEKPTPQQLEYIITRGGKAIVAEAERLYKLTLEYSMETLVDVLRYNWNTYRGRGLVECPKCGFNAVAPDRCCMICGHVVTEEYLRSVLKFDEKFALYLKTASVAELNDVMQLGYLLVGEKGVYSPRSQRARAENPVIYVIQLRRQELSKILEEVNTRDLPV